MRTSDRPTLLRDLKNYLTFLKSYGYTDIPLESKSPLSTDSRKTDGTHPLNESIQHQSDMAKQTPVKKSTVPTLENIRSELGDCTRCKLSSGRKTIVFGSGNPRADLVFVGEGPGKDEDEQGFPFVGRAGKKLTEIIENGMNLRREQDTYICNIVKCRPPGNRDPKEEEISACKPFLVKQLQAIQPLAIVALGKPAASTLLERNVPITKERGTWHEFEGIPLMLTFHPAYLLRFYTLENRRAVMDDMNKVLKKLKG